MNPRTGALLILSLFISGIIVLAPADATPDQNLNPRLVLARDYEWDYYARYVLNTTQYDIPIALAGNNTIYTTLDVYTGALQGHTLDQRAIAHEYRHIEGMTHPHPDKPSKYLALGWHAITNRFGIDTYIPLSTEPHDSYLRALEWLETVKPVYVRV